MCGILAILTAGDPITDVDRAAGERMTDTMAARGPDGRGVLVRDHALLGHRRLAIRDADGGAQPMVTPNGRYALTYNGELYNDRELRDELTREHGVRFRTHCDTETVLHAFAAWGAGCVEKLRGMFAFASVDYCSGDALLARDHCGVKPLFFAFDGQTVLAASSIAALLEHPGVPRRPNFRAISHYLSSFRLTLGAETLYEGIYQLQPGERMRVTRDGVAVDRYWDLPAEQPTISFEEAVDALEAGLDDAVARRLISDRPVGMLLSGGVDSATIAASMAKQRGRFHALAAGDEAANAAETAELVGCELEAIDPTRESYLAAWRQLLESTRLPASTPSDPVILLLAQTLKQRVDVALGGEGADELLCGYGGQHWGGEDFVRHASDAAFGARLAQTYGRQGFQSSVDLFLTVSSLVPSEAKAGLFSEDAWRAADGDAAVLPLYELASGDQAGESPSRRLYRMIHRVNLEGQLSRLDRTTMEASLEARVPFTDRDLCERIAAVPWDRHLTRRDNAGPDLTGPELDAADLLHTKRVLRAAAARRLPEPIAERRKQSFPTPVMGWLVGDWADGVSRTLAASPFAKHLLRGEVLDQIVADPRQGGLLLWPLMNLAQWGDREFVAPSAPHSSAPPVSGPKFTAGLSSGAETPAGR